MPKLLFKPKFHSIGDQTDIFVTSCEDGAPIVCMRCNDVAKFILEQMYPDHKPRAEIIPEVMAQFSVSQAEATEAVNKVITKLLDKGEQGNES